LAIIGIGYEDPVVAAIFISHSSRDNQPAAEIKAWLVRQGYENVFLDFDKDTGLGAGREWERQLYEAIGRCHAVLLVVTPAWLDSKWCFAEFTQARALGKVIFPLVVTPDDLKLIGPTLSAIQAERWDQAGQDHLARRLKEVAEEIARGHRFDPARPPWPGILSFEAEDAAVFFGRDPEIRRICELLEARRAHGGARLVLIVGASGSGKSSVLKAGVLPYLARDRQRFLALRPFRPGRTPMMAFAKMLAEALGEAAAFQARYTELQGAAPLPALAGAVEALTIGSAREATVLVSIDQFEELFTIAGGTERAGFLRLMTAAADQENGLPILLVATVRSDLLGEILKAEGFAIAHEVFTLGGLPSERLRSVIEGPAAVAAIHLEEGLVDRILKDVGAAPEALSLLAFTLRELHHRYGGDRKLTVLEYEELGDRERNLSPLENAVRRTAEETLASATPSSGELAALREAFVGHLVRVNEDGVRLRRPARLQDVPEPARRLVERLVGARLLSIRSDGDANAIEVAHEALFKVWPQLAAWLDEEQDFLIGRRQIEDAERLWATTAAAQQDQALLSGLLLEKARDWSIAHPERLKSVRDFVAGSIRKADLERARVRRRQRVLTVASAAAALVFAILGAVALVQWNRADRQTALAEDQTRIAREQTARAEQETRRAEEQARVAANNATGALAALSTIELEQDDIVDAAKFALAAWPRSALSDDVQLEGVISNLSRVAPDLLERKWAKRDDDSVQGAAFSPHAKRSAILARDRMVLLRDVATGRTNMEGTNEPHFAYPYTNSFAFSPDGSKFVSSSTDDAARLWGMSVDGTPASLEGGDGPVSGVAFSADGSLLAIASVGGRITLWDPEDHLRPRSRFDANVDGELWHLAVSPDRSLIVTGSRDGAVQFWTAGTGESRGGLAEKLERLAGIGYSPDGSLLVTVQSNESGLLRLWDAATHHEVLTAGGMHLAARSSFAFSPNGSVLAVGAPDGRVQFLDIRIGREDEATVESGHSGALTTVAFSPDGQHLLTGGLDGVAKLWNISSRAEIARFDRKGASVAALAFQGDEYILVSYDDGEVQNFRISEDASVAWRKVAEDAPRAVAISSDGTHIAVLGDDSVARVYDTTKLYNATGTAETGSLALPDMWTRALAVSRDGGLIAAATSDGVVQIWDVKKPSKGPLFEQDAKSFEVDFPSPTTLAFSNDGARLAVGGRFLRMAGFAAVWDTANESALLTISDRTSGEVDSITFSPDNSRILLHWKFGGLGWYDVAGFDPANKSDTPTTGLENSAEEWRLLSEEAVQAIALSPDATRAVGLRGNGEVIVVWDASTGAQIARLQGGREPVAQVVFGPRPGKVVSLSSNGTVGLWSLSGVPDGDVFDVVCALLPDHDIPLAGPITSEQPICGETYDPPSPKWMKTRTGYR
jgi:WD40 repeat protein